MKKEDEIPIGTRVILFPESQYVQEGSNGLNSSNPLDCKGTIDEIYRLGSYGVKWDNGTHNCYYTKDLILTNEEYQIF